jgi:integrase
MAQSIRAPKLENRTGRLKLAIRKKPYFIKVDRGIAVGYRRNAGAGTWVARITRNGEDWTKALGSADDFEEATTGQTLAWWTAQARARELAVGRYEHDASKPATVTAALDSYALDLQARGASAENVQMVRGHLPAALAAKPVALLSAKELRAWRDALLSKGLAPASVTRISKPFKAALNLAAAHDPRIVNTRVWKVGLAALPDAESARNVILPESSVRALVNAAWEIDPELGLLVEAAAITGARVSQIARLDVGDLTDGKSPWLNMPTSKKGRGQKRIDRYPVPIPLSLASKLKGNLPNDAPLLLRRDQRWQRGDHGELVRAAVVRAGLNPAEVSIYALRHTSIVRQLLANIPIRVVAVNHDTSAAIIERNYSKHLSAHTDALTRAAMLDLEAPPSSTNVVPLRG